MVNTPRLCLAPMAGLTDLPMRVLCLRMGADYACTEMVSAIGYKYAKARNDTYRQLLSVSPEETNTACQLFGKDPSMLGEAAAKLTALNRFTSLDINMGCPARKVVGSGDGSALMLDPDLAFRIMEAVRANTTLPVSVKTRLGFDAEHMTALEIGRAAETAGCAWITFHGRTRQQQYSGTADHEAIGLLKSQLKLPVIANGDIFTPQDAIRVLKVTGADGIMVGRGCLGNPWLFRGIREAMDGKIPSPVTLDERIDTAILQCRWMVDFKGERLGIVEMRKHVGHYIGGLRGATSVRRQVNLATTLKEMLDILEQFRVLAAMEETEQ